MSEDDGKTRGRTAEERRQKRRYSPRVHGKRLAELVRNALKRRLGEKEGVVTNTESGSSSHWTATVHSDS